MSSYNMGYFMGYFMGSFMGSPWIYIWNSNPSMLRMCSNDDDNDPVYIFFSFSLLTETLCGKKT